MKLVITLVLVIAGVVHAEDKPVSPWTNESQLAVIVTSGNSQNENVSLRQTSSYTKDVNTLKLSGGYLRNQAANTTTGVKEETAFKWDAGLRIDHAFNDQWNLFLGYLVESDKYAGFEHRHNSDLGTKYFIAKKDSHESLAELGYRYVHQNNVSTTQDHYGSARLYLELTYRFSPTTSTKLWGEYIPRLDNSEDYLVNTEASVSSAINTVFSMKFAFLSKTDNLPVPGAKKTDNTTTAALVAKF